MNDFGSFSLERLLLIYLPAINPEKRKYRSVSARKENKRRIVLHENERTRLSRLKTPQNVTYTCKYTLSRIISSFVFNCQTKMKVEICCSRLILHVSSHLLNQVPLINQRPLSLLRNNLRTE